VIDRRTLLKRGSLLIPAAYLGTAPQPSAAAGIRRQRLLLSATRMFDGRRMLTDTALLVEGRTITAVGPLRSMREPRATRLELGDATILPGFIDLHVHVTARGIPFERVLSNGVTTVRDLAGALPSRPNQPGALRYLAAGPMITCPGGYPIPVFGPDGAMPVVGTEQARNAVRKLVAGGAAVIKVALDPGGEPGAPWSMRPATSPPPWPLLSTAEVAAVVAEAHRLGRIVTAHLAEERGVRIALEGGVDEWAHIPCQPVPESLLRDAVRRGIPAVATLDTDSHCTASMDNARTFLAMGGGLLYGTDMGHLDIPEGIDAQELDLMVRAGLSLEQALAAATSHAAAHLGLAPLGTLSPGAPADIIAVPGDITTDLKNIEFPTTVIAGGAVVIETGR
jgi:imidazolonepropionase-like amidohydrolase